MSLSEWFSLLAILTSLTSAGVAWDAKVKADRVARRSNDLSKEANEVQERLLAIEKQRDELSEQIERTPHLSTTKVNLRENGTLFAAEVVLVNMSRHAIHIVAIAIYNTETDDLLAFRRQNKLIQSDEQIDTDFSAEPTSVTAITDIEAGQEITTTHRHAFNLLDEANEIRLYLRYAPTGERVYRVNYRREDTHPLTRAFYIQHKRMVPFDPRTVEVVADVEITKVEV